MVNFIFSFWASKVTKITFYLINGELFLSNKRQYETGYFALQSMQNTQNIITTTTGMIAQYLIEVYDRACVTIRAQLREALCQSLPMHHASHKPSEIVFLVHAVEILPVDTLRGAIDKWKIRSSNLSESIYRYRQHVSTMRVFLAWHKGTVCKRSIYSAHRHPAGCIIAMCSNDVMTSTNKKQAHSYFMRWVWDASRYIYDRDVSACKFTGVVCARKIDCPRKKLTRIA